VSTDNPISKEVLDLCTDVTEPSEAEIGRTVAFRPSARRVWPRAAVALMAAAAVVLLWFVSVVQPEPVSQIVGLGPSIEVSGPGNVVALQVDAAGAEVEVTDGLARFEVDPNGVARNLRVRAGDVTVVVTGTLFTVEVSEAEVAVAVVRGSVDIHADGRVLAIVAGESWRSGEPVVTAPESGVRDVELVPVAVPDAPTKPEAPMPAGSETDVSAVFARLLVRVDDRSDETIEADLLAFIVEYPESPLAVEARTLHIQHLSIADPAGAVSAIDGLLEAEPETPRRVSLLRMRATLARDRLQDCGLALGSYRILDALGDVEAAAWRGICAHSLGFDEEAEDALQRAESLGVSEPLLTRVRQLRNR